VFFITIQNNLLVLNRLLILTEGGANIGLGHIIRCSAIRNYLSSNGWTVLILVHWNGPEFNFDNCKEAAWRDDADFFKTIFNDFDSVLVDSYLAPGDLFLMLKQYFKSLIVIDDYNRLNNYNANLIINPNIYGNNTIQYNGHFIGGNNYVILREAFQSEKRKTKISKQVKNLLITLGGSDVKSLLPRLANLFRNMLYECYFVCGSKHYAIELNAMFNDQKNFHFYDLVNQEQMIELMINADIAISGCGQTLNELAYLGTPTIGIKVGEDQTFNQSVYLKKGFLTKRIIADAPNLLEDLTVEIETLLPYNKRVQLNKIGIDLIDGKGVKRIAKELSDV
jgi:UDP-2,4-diacetamido-2,4,6-trideoxy-beta-L-altropyranose hydrolase